MAARVLPLFLGYNLVNGQYLRGPCAAGGYSVSATSGAATLARCAVSMGRPFGLSAARMLSAGRGHGVDGSGFGSRFGSGLGQQVGRIAGGFDGKGVGQCALGRLLGEGGSVEGVPGGSGDDGQQGE